MIEHLLSFWRCGRGCFEQREHALAAFFGCCLLEETGALMLAGRSQFWRGNERSQDHREKIYAAIVRTLVNNRRLELAHPNVHLTLVRWLSEKTFDRVRRDGLYLSVSRKGEVHSNQQRITEDEAFFALSIGAEALLDPQGDVLPFGPHSIALEQEIDAFRASRERAM